MKFDELEDAAAEERLAYEIDDFDLDIGDGVLHPSSLRQKALQTWQKGGPKLAIVLLAQALHYSSMKIYPLMKNSVLW